MLFIRCRPLRNAPLALPGVSPTSGASPASIALATITIVPIPSHSIAVVYIRMGWDEMVTTSIHCMAMQSYGRTGRPD